jgi:hypothetical protein
MKKERIKSSYTRMPDYKLTEEQEKEIAEDIAKEIDEYIFEKLKSLKDED